METSIKKTNSLFSRLCLRPATAAAVAIDALLSVNDHSSPLFERILDAG